MRAIILLVVLSVCVFSANIPKNYTKAKEMSVRLYQTYHLQSFYTDTNLSLIVYIYEKKFPYKSSLTLQLGMDQSPYEGSKYVARGQKIEWEHIVPASWFITADDFIRDVYENGHEKCETKSGDKYKGRKCAEKVSVLFNQMEADMYNLVPVIGALNALRVDKPYGIIDGEPREFGDTLDIEINKSTIEVMESKRGNVARVMLYMNKKYNIQFPDHNNTVEILNQWSEDDPEDDWEKKKKDILHKTYGMEF